MSLKDLGIHRKDPRFKNCNNGDKNSFTSKLESGQLRIQNWEEIKTVIKEVYELVNPDNNGNVADYIPQLAKKDNMEFSVTLVSVDGQVFEMGNPSQRFCIQSCSKPITYGLALNDWGDKVVHNFVGKEPSGRNFNELCLNEDGLPHNPLINSGAIMTTSLVYPNMELHQRFDKVMDFWRELTFNTVSFDNSVYLSEKETADRNYCLGYMMQESGSFQKGKNDEVSRKISRNWTKTMLKDNLELYFQFCALETNLLGTGLLAATLANGGVHPWTNREMFKPDTIKRILSIMSSCGMYDYSGEWNYEIGIPAKSGVSGLIYAVIPGVCGIATYSPRLDKVGNSYRGVKFFKELGKRVNIHTFLNDENLVSFDRFENNNRKILGFLLLQGSHDNNIDLVRECLAKGCDINFVDYDNRTALHIAYEEENLEIIQFLNDNGARGDIPDRWGNKVENG
jgi:glutaminase